MTIRPRECIDPSANKALERQGKCKFCGSDNVVKAGRAGKNKEQQLFKCKECGHRFLDNGKLPRMKKPKEAVAFALEMYFDGLSLTKISKHLKKFLGVEVHPRKIHEWIEKFAPQVDRFVSQFEPELSGFWNMDEMAVKFRPQEPMTQKERITKVRRKGEQHWHWDVIDKGTRFLIGSHVSKTRSLKDAKAFLKGCKNNTPRPSAIVSDSLGVYHRAINKVYYSRYKDRRVKHLHSSGLKGRRNNQLIERWHSTLRDRLKPMRGLVSPDTQILTGFRIHYNYLRPHQSLNGQTPAESASIDLPFEDGWGDLITWATRWQTLQEIDGGEN